jgi:hypothetical protein
MASARQRTRRVVGKAEGQGFAVERSETTLKSVRTPVFETHLRFPSKYL